MKINLIVRQNIGFLAPDYLVGMKRVSLEIMKTLAYINLICGINFDFFCLKNFFPGSLAFRKYPVIMKISWGNRLSVLQKLGDAAIYCFELI